MIRRYTTLKGLNNKQFINNKCQPKSVRKNYFLEEISNLRYNLLNKQKQLAYDEKIRTTLKKQESAATLSWMNLALMFSSLT